MKVPRHSGATMGNKKSQLTVNELQEYKELTYLTEREIQYAFIRFKNLNPRVLNEDKSARISTNIIRRMPELRNNPFADRICEIFSSETDSCWSFDDFIDMVSAFHTSTPLEVKAQYAFDIYDFDGDGYLSRSDLKNLAMRLAGIEVEDHEDSITDDSKLTPEEMEHFITKVFSEADIDQDGVISLAEFKHVLMKCPDFSRSFTIRI